MLKYSLLAWVLMACVNCLLRHFRHKIKALPGIRVLKLCHQIAFGFVSVWLLYLWALLWLQNTL
jgi:hypothetical protein